MSFNDLVKHIGTTKLTIFDYDCTLTQIATRILYQNMKTFRRLQKNIPPSISQIIEKGSDMNKEQKFIKSVEFGDDIRKKFLRDTFKKIKSYDHSIIIKDDIKYEYIKSSLEENKLRTHT